MGVSLNIITEAEAGLGIVGVGEAKVTLGEANTTDGLKGASGQAGIKGKFGVAAAASVTGNFEFSGKSSALAVIAERLGFRSEAERHESEREND